LFSRWHLFNFGRMGKILVLFHSKSGNTARMAAEIAEGARRIPGSDVRVRPVADATADDVRWCDGLALGSPTNMGTVAWEMKRFWDETMSGDWGKLDGRIGCAFSSEGGWGGGAELTCLSLHTILMNYGFLVFGITDYVAHQFTLHYGATLAGEPREAREIEACRRLGQRLAEWVAVYCDGRKDEHPLTSGRPRFPWKT
jgi:NAD(P)H dehydrogenase (quinone)